jgi:hypothetical protein
MGTPPSATARGTPEGIPLRDGFAAFITFSEDATIEFFETAVGIPPIEGGDPIPTTTMHNTSVMTNVPQALYALEEFTIRAGYDPEVFDVFKDVTKIINKNQTITITFADGSTWAFYGYPRRIEAAQLEKGTFPECDITIMPTNVDPTDFSEQEPVFVDVPGT